MLYRIVLLLLLFPIQAAFCQPGVETFNRIKIGMTSKAANDLFKREWPGAEDFDTDIWTTYAVGGPVDAYLPGTFRFLIYHFGYIVGDKELRISCTPQTATKVFDSVLKKMVVLYNNPKVDTMKAMIGMKGMVRYASWTFPITENKDLYRLDIALYQVSDRKTVTMQLIAFSKSYYELMEMKENDYLHLVAR